MGFKDHIEKALAEVSTPPIDKMTLARNVASAQTTNLSANSRSLPVIFSMATSNTLVFAYA